MKDISPLVSKNLTEAGFGTFQWHHDPDRPEKGYPVMTGHELNQCQHIWSIGGYVIRMEDRSLAVLHDDEIARFHLGIGTLDSSTALSHWRYLRL